MRNPRNQEINRGMRNPRNQEINRKLITECVIQEIKKFIHGISCGIRCISCGGYPVEEYVVYPVEDILWTTLSLYILWRISCGLRCISCGDILWRYPVEDILWRISCGGYTVEYLYIL